MNSFASNTVAVSMNETKLIMRSLLEELQTDKTAAKMKLDSTVALETSQDSHRTVVDCKAWKPKQEENVPGNNEREAFLQEDVVYQNDKVWAILVELYKNKAIACMIC